MTHQGDPERKRQREAYTNVYESKNPGEDGTSWGKRKEIV